MSAFPLMDLPDHIIARILSHIPGHYEVSSVCRKFYEMDCYNSLKNSNITLFWPRIECDIAFQRGLPFKLNLGDSISLDSILSSKRPISQIFFDLDFNDPEEIENARKISQLHGSSVKELTIINESKSDNPIASVTGQKFIQLLNCFPNLEELVIDLRKVEIVQRDEGSNEVLKLPKIKKITIESSCNSLAFLTKHISEKLSTFKMNLRSFGGSDKTQKGIRKLRATKLELFEKLKSLKLEELSYKDSTPSPVKWPELRSLLMAQRESLKFLTVEQIGENFENELFQELKLLKKFESLEVGYISSAGAESFSKLTNLKRLKIVYDCDLEPMSFIRTVPLEELSFRDISKVPTNVLQQIGRNYPIKSLQILRPSQKLNVYMQTFPRLESLHLTFCIFKISSKMSGIHNGVSFPNMKSFSVLNYLHGYNLERPDSSDFLFEIMAAFPNLEDLIIVQDMKFSLDFLKTVKTSLPRLKKLKIYSFIINADLFCNEEEETVRVLQQLSKSLKSVKLQFNVDGIPEKEKFFEFFLRLEGYFRTGRDFTLRK